MKLHKVLNFFIKIYEIWQSGKSAKIGLAIMCVGVSLIVGGGVNYSFFYSDINTTVGASVQSQDSSIFVLIFGVIILIVGLLIVLNDWIKLNSKKAVFYFANQLKMGDSNIPKYALSTLDRMNLIEEYLPLIDSYHKKTVLKEYKSILRSFEHRIKHKQMDKIFIGSLASTPYLFLLGTLIRNGHIDSIILDYDRNSNKWYQLPGLGEDATHVLVNEYNNVTIEDKIKELCNSSEDDIGIALSYTYEIHKNSVPEELRENTLYLKNSLGFGHDKLSNKATQRELLDEVVQYIDKFKSCGKRVNIFIAAQSSMCINLGKRYQDNTMNELIIYNFNGDQRKYDWKILFNCGKVS